MTDFVALYRGQTVAEAELVAVSAEKRLVRRFFMELLGDSEQDSEDSECPVVALRAAKDGDE